jgi:MATE family multidrug resistance protein
LDLVFVLGFNWGVEGVATATFLAEWSGAILGVYLCRNWLATPGWRDAKRVFDRVRLAKMAALNRDIMIRSVLLQAIFVSFLFLGSDFGDVPLAANQILLQFLHITAFGLDGFAFAAETLVGQAMGARNRTALRRGALLASGWGLVVVVGLSIAFAVAGPAVIDIMTTAPEVRAEARLYLGYMVLAPLIGVLPWMLDGIFIGATRARDMRNMMLISAVIYAASAAVLVPLWGNHGLWLSLLISFAARGITLAFRYPALEADADQSVEYIPS